MHTLCAVLNRENFPSSIFPAAAFDKLVQMLHMLWARQQGMARSLQGPEAWMKRFSRHCIPHIWAAEIK